MKSSWTSIALRLFIFFLLSLTPSKSSASSTNSKHGITMNEKYISNTVDGSSLEEAEASNGDDELMNTLIGAEVCTDGDEECLKRRIISEAHLDYIYTQQEKP